MEIMTLAIAVFAVIIGLVIDMSSTSAKMKSSRVAALNAEQEATNLPRQAERSGFIKWSQELFKKEAPLEAKEKPENTVKKWRGT